VGCDAGVLVLRGFGGAAGVVSRRGELAAFGISFDAGASFDAAGAGATDFDGAEGRVEDGSASAFGLAGLPMTASVSATGVAAGLGDAAVGGATGAGEAATGAG
jgi:hypothetical protein